jgi:hypothetical protein
VSSEAFENAKNWMLELHRLFVAGAEDDLAPDGSDGRGDQLRELLTDNDDLLTAAEITAICYFSGDLYEVQYHPETYTEEWALERLERNRNGI